MLLLIETLSDDNNLKVITEDKNNNEKKYYIEGIFAQAEIKNRNGRIYPKRVLEKALESYQSVIQAKRALGELNHPNHPNVNPERASHLVERLVWEGNNVIGRAKVLTSLPMGKIVKGLIDEGVSFGVSTRGLGTLIENDGVKIVQDDFVLNAIDIVSDPSGIDCWVEGVLESKEWVLDASSGKWIAVESAKKQLQSLSRKQIEEQKLILFAKFLEQIK